MLTHEKGVQKNYWNVVFARLKAYPEREDISTLLL